MGSLQDELLDAGFVSRKDLAHAEAAARAQARIEGRRVRPPARRTRQAGRAGAQEAADAQAAELVASGREQIGARATRRWYFEARADVIRYLDVDDDVARKLERGRAAIVEAPDGTASVVGQETAIALEGSAPGWVRFRVVPG